MSWKSHLLCFVVTATLTSLKGCNGGAVEGKLRVRSVPFAVKHESSDPPRFGSLAIKAHREGEQKSTPALRSFLDAKLKRLDPSVQCSDNLMTLTVKRARGPPILVNSGEGPLTPLSQIPSSCGFSVKRSRRDVHFTAPYQGCHVTQQEGNYVLPLRLWGTPMTMSCPAVLPPPSVSCFPSGMVVKIGGITANELRVKVSGAWMTLSSVCDSCGFAVEVFSGGLTLTAPYNRGLCIEVKDKEYLLSLSLVDVELLVTCPSLPEIKSTTATTMPPSDSGPVLHYPQFPHFPMFLGTPRAYPGLPVHALPSQTPAPTTGTVAQLPQQPQFLLGPASQSGSNTENQGVPVAQHPSLPFMQQYPQFSQYAFFNRPVPQTQSPTTKNTAAADAQSPQAPQSRHDGMPVPQQLQFPVPSQYHFLPFPKLPMPPGDNPQTVQDPKPGIQQPKPQHVYPQIYQIPILYPPPKYPSQRQNTQSPTAAPTTNTTSAATVQKPFHYPHPYMPFYYASHQAPMPVFPDPPTTPLSNPAPSDQHEHHPIYLSMPPFYHLLSHQRPN